MSDTEHTSCTILLDDAQSTIQNPSSRLYQHPIAHLTAATENELSVVLDAIQDALKSKQYVVANLSYELGEHWMGLKPKNARHPWLEAWVFDSVKKLSKQEVDQWLNHQSVDSQDELSGMLSIASNIDKLEFEKHI